MTGSADRCVPCAAAGGAVHGAGLHERVAALDAGWRAANEHHLEKEYRFRNFAEALAFANRVGEVAESLGHHPELHVKWGAVVVLLWTHKRNGITDADFTLAARADELARHA
jgi:4a-hydroxytetrahydrobiopterin dehydratase